MHMVLYLMVLVIQISRLLSDANGYSMIANGGSTPTASGSILKVVRGLAVYSRQQTFKVTISQYNGYIISADCDYLNFDYENDKTGNSDVNNSLTSIVSTSASRTDVTALSQSPSFFGIWIISNK
jgi:hypothetical protein